MITALTILIFVLGSTAYAASPSPVSRSTAGSTNSVSSASLAYSSKNEPIANYAANPNIPGATGRVIVRGDNSTIAGDEAATQMEQTGSLEN
jgi:hypothetical protein